MLNEALPSAELRARRTESPLLMCPLSRRRPMVAPALPRQRRRARGPGPGPPQGPGSGQPRGGQPSASPRLSFSSGRGEPSASPQLRPRSALRSPSALPGVSPQLFLSSPSAPPYSPIFPGSSPQEPRLFPPFSPVPARSPCPRRAEGTRGRCKLCKCPQIVPGILLATHPHSCPMALALFSLLPLSRLSRFRLHFQAVHSSLPRRLFIRLGKKKNTPNNPTALLLGFLHLYFVSTLVLCSISPARPSGPSTTHKPIPKGA